MKTIFIYLSLVGCVSLASAQQIRKNYLEMTASEYADYDAALQIIWNGGGTAVGDHSWFANMHATHFFTNMHSGGGGENFTSFHRFFLLHWELMLQNSNPAYSYLNIGYWDWRDDPSKSITVGINPGNAPNFLAYTFLPMSNFTTWTGLTRATTFPPPGAGLPFMANYNLALSRTSFMPPAANNFSQDLEFNNHNSPHGWIAGGGTMGNTNSPLDPVFYSHHAMVDKIWQDWEDQNMGIQSVFPASPYIVPGYRTLHGWIDDLDANTCADSRSVPFRDNIMNPFVSYDVWYAENGKVVLDGANGSDFIVNGNGKIYRYTANTPSGLFGSMYIGDVYRDPSNNILPDTKGGFVVPAGVSAHFRAGGDIVMLPGAAFYGSPTEEITFKIITAPNGF